MGPADTPSASARRSVSFAPLSATTPSGFARSQTSCRSHHWYVGQETALQVTPPMRAGQETTGEVIRECSLW